MGLRGLNNNSNTGDENMEREYDIKTDVINMEISAGLPHLDTINFSKEELTEYRDWLWEGARKYYNNGMAEMEGSGY